MPPSFFDAILGLETTDILPGEEEWQRISVERPANKRDRGFTGVYVQSAPSGLPQDATYKSDYVFMGIPPEDGELRRHKKDEEEEEKKKKKTKRLSRD